MFSSFISAAAPKTAAKPAIKKYNTKEQPGWQDFVPFENHDEAVPGLVKRFSQPRNIAETKTSTKPGWQDFVPYNPKLGFHA